MLLHGPGMCKCNYERLFHQTSDLIFIIQLLFLIVYIWWLFNTLHAHVYVCHPLVFFKIYYSWQFVSVDSCFCCLLALLTISLVVHWHLLNVYFSWQLTVAARYFWAIYFSWTVAFVVYLPCWSLVFLECLPFMSVYLSQVFNFLDCLSFWTIYLSWVFNVYLSWVITFYLSWVLLFFTVYLSRILTFL